MLMLFRYAADAMPFDAMSHFATLPITLLSLLMLAAGATYADATILMFFASAAAMPI